MDNADIASPNGMDVGVFEDARDGPGGGEVGYGGGASPPLSAGQSSSISSHPASGFTHPTHDSMSSAPSSSSHRHVLSDDLSYGAASSKEVYNLNDEPPTRPRGSSRVSSYSSTHGRVGETSNSSYTRHDGVGRHAQGLGQSQGYGTARAPPPGPLPMLPAQHPYAAGGAGSESASSSTYAPSHAPSGSVAVRIPGRIPSSAERKSSLPPPISPRTASLSQQQSSLPVSSGTDGYAGQASSVASGSTSTLHAPAYAESSRSRPNAGGVGGSNMNGHPTSAPAARTRSPRPPRVPSRHLLQSALDLAQQAVQMDQRHDIAGALAAYREAVSRLKAVMERVAADAERDGKRRRSGKSEEEGRTLQGIHDAYVARIQLLGTYETHDASSEPPPHSPGTGSGLMPSPSLDMSTPMDHAGTSTATLVPRRSPAAHHEVLDDPGGTSIGALMLGAPIDQVGSSVSSDSVAGQGSSMGTAGIAAVPEEGAAHSNSGTGIGLGLPTSPAKRIWNGDRPGTSGSGASTPSRHNRLRNQSMSKGLEDEIGLTEADGLVEYTSEPEEETLTSPIPPLSATSPVKKGHHSRTSSLGRLGQLISSSTSQGTISQRRKQPTSPRISISSKGESESGLPSSRSLAIPRRQRELERAEPIMAGVRSRSVSQPGGRRGEGYQAEMGDNVPPLPDVRKKTSFSNMTGATGYRGTSVRSDSLAPPSQVAHRSTSQSSLMRSDAGSIASRRTPRSANGSLISPVPPAQPTEVLHRPFHVLRILRSSMDADGPGAYLTGAIHIPSAVWNPAACTKEGTRLPGPRITAQDVKVRVIDQMLLHLEIIRHTGALLLEGPREVNFAVAGVAPPRVGSKKCMDTGDEFVKVLEAFEEEMDGVYKSLLKGGVVLDAWKGKKGSNAMSWGSKMARSMDKMSGSSKGLETPDRYVDILAALCSALQTLDDHLYNFTSPCTPAYHALSENTYRQLEIRMLRAADFVKVVVAPFVLDDFKQFFHRYLRAGMLYIET